MVMQTHHIVKLYIHCYLVLLLALCEVSNSFMNISWEKGVLFKDAINVKIIYHKRWMWSSDKMTQQVYKQSAQSNTCPSATLSTTNPTWTDMGLKLGPCNAMPATA
jgi:hypothetical protein